KELVWISNERNDMNPGTLFDPFSALRPSAYALFYSAKPRFKASGYCWIIRTDECQDFFEVAQCFGRIDDLHVRRCRANTASTSSSVAKRPSRAALRPRSIPSSSSAVA